MPTLHLNLHNPAHARIAGWLNVWPDYVALNPLPTGVNLYPLEQAFVKAGAEIAPRKTWLEHACTWWHYRN